jgi:predicted nucleic acid-binding Zn ribbon protein
MPENLPDHTHCLQCEAAIPEGRPFCSDACESAYREKAKKDRDRNTLFLVAAIAIVLVVALVTVFL